MNAKRYAAPPTQPELEPLGRPKTLPPRELCPRCLMRGKLAALVVGHCCHCLDGVCPRCKRPLYVTVLAVDERGSYSERQPCGCFLATPRTS